MKKYILCLANSHKYNERCIAGVELIKKDKDTFSLVKSDSEVKWIRPVSKGGHGEISSKVVNQMKLLDIYEVEIIEACPAGFQSENVIIQEKSLRYIKSIKPERKNLDKIVNDLTGPIFFNKGKAVIKDKINLLEKSLLFVKPETIRFVPVKNIKVQDQLRIEFTHKNVIYNFPVTDVAFLKNYTQNPQVLKSINEAYFTISLGLEFEGWHFKLIAGVIIV